MADYTFKTTAQEELALIAGGGFEKAVRGFLNLLVANYLDTEINKLKTAASALSDADKIELLNEFASSIEAKK